MHDITSKLRDGKYLQPDVDGFHVQSDTEREENPNKKEPRVSNNKTPVQQTPAAACRPDWGFNKTAVPPGGNS